MSKVLIVLLCFLYSSEAKSCIGTAKYTLTFEAKWTSQSHGDFPSGAHFSPLVGCSHYEAYVMWTPGDKATTGVKNVAELGSTGTLNREMQQQETLKRVFKRYIGNGIGGGTGTVRITNIEVNSNYPLVSFITMIAPSPDWFVGVHDYNLCDMTTGNWRQSRSRDLPPYDSGTDSGPNFRSGNNPTRPPVDIHLITKDISGSLEGPNPIKPFGTFTFVKTSESNVTVAPLLVKESPTAASTTAARATNTARTTNTAHPGTNLHVSLVIILIFLNIFGSFF